MAEQYETKSNDGSHQPISSGASNGSGFYGAKVAQKLKITNSAVSRSVARGEKIASEMNLKLIEFKNA